GFDARYGIGYGQDVGGYVRSGAVVFVVAAAARLAGAAASRKQGGAGHDGQRTSGTITKHCGCGPVAGHLLLRARPHGCSAVGRLRCRTSRGEWLLKRRASSSVM